METKKYKLTEETINIMDRTLYCIEALRDFANVKKGDKGGFIEKEDNLSQSGNCWVYENAQVYGNAKVYSNAWIYGNVKIYGNAWIYGNVKVYGNAEVYDDALVYGNAVVCDDAKVYDDAVVYGNAEIFGNAEILGNAEVFGNARICGNAEVCDNADYIVFKNWWSSGRYFTWTRSNNMWKVGCFYGTGEQLIEKAYKDSEKSGREYEKIVRYTETVN